MPYPPDIVAKIRKQIVARLMAGTLHSGCISAARRSGMASGNDYRSSADAACWS